MTREKLGETVYYLIPNTIVQVEFFEEKPSASICRIPWK